MKIKIIPIAERKLRKRGIASSWVEETVGSPEQVVPGFGGRKVAHKRYTIRGRRYLLRVVYEEKADIISVITAYLTSQVKRYWEGTENEDRI